MFGKFTKEAVEDAILEAAARNRLVRGVVETVTGRDLVGGLGLVPRSVSRPRRLTPEEEAKVATASGVNGLRKPRNSARYHQNQG